jgi:hypothetical protein
VKSSRPEAGDKSVDANAAMKSKDEGGRIKDEGTARGRFYVLLRNQPARGQHLQRVQRYAKGKHKINYSSLD